jgi:guanylate kinase
MASWDRYLRKEGLLFILSGPSGVGKDAVLAELLQALPGVRRCVTTTTRDKRDGEIDGVDYTFVSVDEFRERIAEDGFLEYAEVYGNLYGTPRRWVEDTLASGLDVVLKIDVQGGLAVKRAVPEAIGVFLVPPSMEELERRLRARNSESEESARRRLRNARLEMEQIPHYDYLVENRTIDRAVEELKAVVIAEHRRIR